MTPDDEASYIFGNGKEEEEDVVLVFGYGE